MKLIRDEEIYSISYFVYNEYVKNEKNFDFKMETYKSLKELTDVWYFSSYLEKRLRYFDLYKNNKTVQGYLRFICKNLICENIKKISHSEIIDFGHHFRLMEHHDTFYFYDDWFEFIYHPYDTDDPDLHVDNGILLPFFAGNDYENFLDIYNFLRAEYIYTGIDFDFNNHTWRSLKRLSDEWHYEDEIVQDRLDALEFKKLLDTNWEKSQINDFTYEKDGKKWTINEITSGKLLYEEGKIMNHCCFSYLKNCIKKDCMFFSVKCDNKKYEERIATVEVSKHRRIMEAKGESNSFINKETKDIVKIWADENKIDC